MATLFLFSTEDSALRDVALARAKDIGGSSVVGLNRLSDFTQVLRTYAQARIPIRELYLVVGLNRLSDFTQVLRTTAQARIPIHELYLFAHGNPGGVKIGRTNVDVADLNELRNQGLDRAFSVNAKITFESCEIAESAEGELFLAEFGSILLRRGGGEVIGSTGVGYAPWGLFGGAVWYFGARQVIAKVNVGGGVRLINSRYLRADVLRYTVEYLGDQIRRILRSSKESDFRHQCEIWWRLLTSARGFIYASAPYSDLYKAWKKIDPVVRGMMELGVIPTAGTLPDWQVRPWLLIPGVSQLENLPDAREEATSVNNLSRGLEAPRSAYSWHSVTSTAATTAEDRSMENRSI